MASIEINAEQALGQIEVRDGRRVLVLIDVFDKTVTEGGAMTFANEVVIALDPHSPDSSIRRLGFMLTALADIARAEARHDAHRGGRVIASAGGPEN